LKSCAANSIISADCCFNKALTIVVVAKVIRGLFLQHDHKAVRVFVEDGRAASHQLQLVVFSLRLPVVVQSCFCIGFLVVSL